MADLLPQSDFTALTGKSLNGDETSRYSEVLGVAAQELERLLGWPLDPSSWSDLYLETGKARNQSACPDVDTDSLDPADPVEFSYRLFPWNEPSPVIAFDPCKEINLIKLVKDDITLLTMDPADYRVTWRGGPVRWAKYAELSRNWLGDLRSWYGTCRYPNVQVAIDADWLWPLNEGEGDADDTYGLPADLKMVLASLVNTTYDDKRDLQSESLEDYSWTRRQGDGDDPRVAHRQVLDFYAGPNGAVKKPRVA